MSIKNNLVRDGGIEPPTFSMSMKRSTTELIAHFVRVEGIGPSTSILSVWRSTTELHSPI